MARKHRSQLDAVRSSTPQSAPAAKAAVDIAPLERRIIDLERMIGGYEGRIRALERFIGIG